MITINNVLSDLRSFVDINRTFESMTAHNHRSSQTFPSLRPLRAGMYSNGSTVSGPNPRVPSTSDARRPFRVAANPWNASHEAFVGQGMDIAPGGGRQAYLPPVSSHVVGYQGNCFTVCSLLTPVN